MWFPPFDSPKQQYGRSMPKTMKPPPKQNNNTNSKILHQVKATMGNREGTILQFVEKEKRLKKGVDIWFAVWYYNKAVARESEKQEKMKWIGSGSNPTTQIGRAFVLSFELSFKTKNKKSFKKLLTNA